MKAVAQPPTAHGPLATERATNDLVEICFQRRRFKDLCQRCLHFQQVATPTSTSKSMQQWPPFIMSQGRWCAEGGRGEAAEVGRLGGGLGFWQCSSPTHTHTHTHARINVASSMTTTTTSPRENPAGQDSRCDFPCDLTSFACRCRTVTCHASRTSAHR